MLRAHRCFPLLAALAIATTAVDAQTPASSPAREGALGALLAGLSADADVRVLTVGGVVEEGRVGVVGDRSFSMAREGSSHLVDFGEVRTVEIEGGHGLQGALWGVAGGALAGGFFGTMIGSFDCTDPIGCTDSEQRGAWSWGALLGAVGGGLGFWWGRRQRHWHPVFP